ncbi:MAG: hypothetical protein OXI56_11625 [bacterium]|nr:hypothetical protein [bacterium]MDE0602432.1 hypothetical protein [bacterium]
MDRIEPSLAFVDSPGSDLRQGDICLVSAFPRWSLRDAADVMTVGKGSVTEDKDLTSLQLPVWDRVMQYDGDYLVAICSHDCELENPRARVGILIAPLLEIPMSHPKHAEIMASGEPANGQYSYIHQFPLYLATASAVVEFSSIIHLAGAEDAKDTLTQNKLFEMADLTRRDFKRKLGVFLSRE